MYVEVEVGDKTRKLRYDFNALADIEERAGLGIGAMFSEQRTGFQSIRMLIWGGLKWQDRGLTVERAGNLVKEYLRDGGTLEELMGKVHEAMKKSGLIDFKEVDDDYEEGEEGNAEAETG